MDRGAVALGRRCGEPVVAHPLLVAVARLARVRDAERVRRRTEGRRDRAPRARRGSGRTTRRPRRRARRAAARGSSRGRGRVGQFASRSGASAPGRSGSRRRTRRTRSRWRARAGPVRGAPTPRGVPPWQVVHPTSARAWRLRARLAGLAAVADGARAIDGVVRCTRDRRGADERNAQDGPQDDAETGELGAHPAPPRQPDRRGDERERRDCERHARAQPLAAGAVDERQREQTRDRGREHQPREPRALLRDPLEQPRRRAQEPRRRDVGHRPADVARRSQAGRKLPREEHERAHEDEERAAPVEEVVGVEAPPLRADARARSRHGGEDAGQGNQGARPPRRAAEDVDHRLRRALEQPAAKPERCEPAEHVGALLGARGGIEDEDHPAASVRRRPTRNQTWRRASESAHQGRSATWLA